MYFLSDIDSLNGSNGNCPPGCDTNCGCKGKCNGCQGSCGS